MLPNSILDFCRKLEGRNITEFNYRLDKSRPDVAQVFVGVALKDACERTHIVNHLNDTGYPSFDLTDDEIAKTHIRYLIGGHARLADEKLFRVVFPERSNALLHFLEKLGQDIVDALTEIGYDCEELTDNLGYQVFLK